MIKITFPDGSVREYAEGTTAYQIAESISPRLAADSLAASVNGATVDMTRPIGEDASVKFYKWDDEEGKHAFWHTSSHLLAEALEALYPGIKFGIGPAIENGFYYDVDLGDTKNIVGAFWQPKLVIVDPETLSPLPRRHYINGLAEAVKAGLLADPELFAIFEKGDIDEQIGEIIYRSLRFKKNVVEQDETERGMRKALNFGHTIGHGIEAVKGIKGRRTVGLFHGECVALGMLPMIESKALQKRVRAVYRRLGLPLRTAYNKDKVYAEMLHDKKAQGGQITVIKVPGLGCWRAETIPVEGLRPLLGMEE